MITNYRSFYINHVLNETDRNFINTYWLTQFVKNPPDKNKKISEFINDRSLINKELEKIERYLCVDVLKSQKNEYDYNQLLYTLKFFVKTRVWNKVVSILYGNDFKGDPSNDSRKIINSKLNFTTGATFSMLWDNIDSYCDNAVEFISTDEIDDTLENITILAGEIGRDYLVTAIACMVIALSFEFPPGAAVATAELTVITGKYLSKFKTIYGKISKITPAVIKTYKKFMTYGDKLWLSYGIVEVVKVVIKLLLEEPEIKAIAETNINDKLEEGHEDKNKFINKVKNKLEKHSNLKNTWESISFDLYSDLENMPNWLNWNKSDEGKSIKAQQFGYVITYYISLYCWQFQEYAIYYNWLKKIEKGEIDIEKAKKDIDYGFIDLKSINVKSPSSDNTSVFSKKY